MKKIILASLLSLASAGAANATLIATVSSSGALPGQTYAPLNSLPLGSASGTYTSGISAVFTGPNAAVVSGSSTNNYAAPVFSGGNGLLFNDANGTDMTRFIAVGTGSTATLTLPNTSQYLGLLWGSVDSYNTLTFFSGVNGTGTSVGSVLGSSLPPPTNGSQSLYVNVNSTVSFQSVVLTSTRNAFELDDIAFGSTSVPEPVSMALLGSGLIGLAAFRRSRAK